MPLPLPLSEDLRAAGLQPVEDAPLARRTWWQVGGPADGFVKAGTVAEVQAVMRACHSHSVPVFVLGNGTNLLISDRGIRGVVLQLAKGLARAEALPGEPTLVQAGGGTKLAALLQKAMRHGWTGLEVFAGIPGTVGGAVRMNAGARLGETRDVLVDADVVLPDGRLETWSLERLDMRYRHTALPLGSVVAHARLRTTEGDADAMREQVQHHLEHRAQTQPLDLPSCGSTFRNPPGDHAGRLIEAAGLKGYRIGDVQVSEKHANFVVNLGAATADDVRRVVEHMADTVESRFGVRLTREVHLAGDWSHWGRCDVSDIVSQLHRMLREGEWVELVARARAERAQPGPNTPHVEGLLARAWVRLGQPEEAGEAAQSARRVSSSDDVILASAESWLALGDPGRGRAELAAIGATGGQLAHEVDLSMAMLMRAMGEAEQGYGRATATLARAQAQTDDPLRVEEALVVVGHTAWPSGDLDAARGAFQRALLQRQQRGASPVLLAEALDGLGVCARHENAPFEAVTFHEQALEYWVAGAGDDSGPVSACRHQLAQALHRTGDFLAARDEMARALLATGATLGKDHVDTWITRFELARYELDCGDPERGLPRMAQARAEVTRRLGVDHPVVKAMDRFL